MMSEPSGHARQARTEEVAGFVPKGMPMMRPMPSRYVFERPRPTRRPSATSVMSIIVSSSPDLQGFLARVATRREPNIAHAAHGRSYRELFFMVGRLLD